jgi:hypothetical protein
VAVWFTVPFCYLFAHFLHVLVTESSRDAQLVLRCVVGQKVDRGLPRQVMEERVVRTGDGTS